MKRVWLVGTGPSLKDTPMELLSQETVVAGVNREVPKCSHDGYAWGNTRAIQSWHLPQICTAFGEMSVMMQLAVLDEYEEIYLLACDYASGNDLAIHHMAKRSSPVPIYNCTLGGELEVYPRKDIRAVLRAG